MSSDYYVYAYERKIASKHGPAGSFYYIGKGRGNRARRNHGHIHVPKDPKRIVMIKVNLTEEDAFSLEKSQIKEYGRIDNGTGCLRNLSDGGEGPSGYKFTEEQCAKNSANQKIVRGTSEARAKQSATMKKYWEDPKAIAKRSDIMKKYWKNSEIRDQQIVAQSVGQKKRWEDPEAVAKQSDIMKAVWATKRANQSKNHATLDQFLT